MYPEYLSTAKVSLIVVKKYIGNILNNIRTARYFWFFYILILQSINEILIGFVSQLLGFL